MRRRSRKGLPARRNSVPEPAPNRAQSVIECPQMAAASTGQRNTARSFDRSGASPRWAFDHFLSTITSLHSVVPTFSYECDAMIGLKFASEALRLLS